MNGFDISTISNCYIGGTQASAIYIGNNKLWPTAHDYSLDYFTIESLEDNNEIQFIKGSSAPVKTIEWSIDGTTWTSSTSSTTPTVVTTLNTGDKIMIRGNNTQYASSGSGGYENRLISTKTINMYGNIMSLLYGDNFVGQTTLPAKYTFCRLFSAGKMIDTSNLILPATNTTEACYRSLLDNNSTLIYTPKILPALTLTKECYVNMFNKAYNIITSPILPALTLAQECYGGLFWNCSKLDNITCLATNISASQCTNMWVYNVKSTGTFTKNSSMTSWTRGQYGIPSGWTVVNA